jgi:hypothetical protein
LEVRWEKWDIDYTIGIDLENEAGRRDGSALEIATLQGSKKRRFIQTCIKTSVSPLEGQG